MLVKGQKVWLVRMANDGTYGVHRATVLADADDEGSFLTSVWVRYSREIAGEPAREVVAPLSDVWKVEALACHRAAEKCRELAARAIVRSHALVARASGR